MSEGDEALLLKFHPLLVGNFLATWCWWWWWWWWRRVSERGGRKSWPILFNFCCKTNKEWIWEEVGGRVETKLAKLKMEMRRRRMRRTSAITTDKQEHYTRKEEDYTSNEYSIHFTRHTLLPNRREMRRLWCCEVGMIPALTHPLRNIPI